MTETALKTATYDPYFYNVATMDEARSLILSGEAEGFTTEHRWKTETPYLAKLFLEHAPMDQKSVLLDYGCGIGRMSLELMVRTQCRTVGVDLSSSMRALAASYVDHGSFMAAGHETVGLLGKDWADVGIAVWVLQHCAQVDQDIARIYAALKPGGKFLIVNESRLVPTKEYGFVSDTVDVQAELAKVFTLEKEIPLDSLMGLDLSGRTYCEVYRKE